MILIKSMPHQPWTSLHVDALGGESSEGKSKSSLTFDSCGGSNSTSCLKCLIFQLKHNLTRNCKVSISAPLLRFCKRFWVYCRLVYYISYTCVIKKQAVKHLIKGNQPSKVWTVSFSESVTRLYVITHTVLQVVNSTARLILSIVVQDCVGVSPAKVSLYLQKHGHTLKSNMSTQTCTTAKLQWSASDLMTKHKSRDPSHKLRKEDQWEKHGVLHKEERKREICIDNMKPLRWISFAFRCLLSHNHD